MDSVSYKISLDIKKTGTQVFLPAIRGDNKRNIVISLVEGGVPYSVRGIGEAAFTAVKPDGTTLYNACTIDTERNAIVYEFTEQTTAASGVMNCQIKLIGSSGGIISTPAFGIIVSDTLYNEQHIFESSNEFNMLTRIIEELEKRAASYISSIYLPASGWQGDASPYSQVVDIDGVTEYSKVDINPTVEQLAIFHNKDVTFVTENDDGVVTVYCIGQKPTGDYKMQVTITEVNENA